MLHVGNINPILMLGLQKESNSQNGKKAQKTFSASTVIVSISSHVFPAHIIISSWVRENDSLVGKVLIILYATSNLSSSSSIIENIQETCKYSSTNGYVYFFFDSRNADSGLRTFDNFLRSALSQLSARCGGTPTSLKEIYQAHGSGRDKPSTKALQAQLQVVMEGFDHIYIMLDALDECGERLELLQWIHTIASLNLAGLHLLLTSRMEPEIKGRLVQVPKILPIQFSRDVVNQDINAYLEERISHIDRWNEETRALVKTTLAAGAGGMYVTNQH